MFLLVTGVNGILISVGALIGDAFSEHWFIGVLAAAVVGMAVSVTFAGRFELLEGAEWAMVLRFSAIGFFGGMLIASLNDLNLTLIAITGTLGSGIGALLGKYIDRFFVNRPPQRLF